MTLHTPNHRYRPEFTLDGGDLDWNTGLRWLVERQLRQMQPGELLEIISKSPGVESALLHWCQFTKNEHMSTARNGGITSILLVNGALASRELPPKPTENTSDRLVVRRLPPLALYTRQINHPLSHLGSESNDNPYHIPTASVISTTLNAVDIQQALDAAFQRDVQIICFELGEQSATQLIEMGSKLNSAINGRPPERLAIQLRCELTPEIASWFCTVSVGSMLCDFFPSNDLLQLLPLERRFGINIKSNSNVETILAELLEIISIERLIVMTDETNESAISQLGTLLEHFRERYHVNSTVTESYY